MFKLNQTEQMGLFDPINNLTPYQEKKLKESWSYYFREEIFPKINEQKFAVLYSDKISRPNTPVNIMVSLLIIKEMTGLTDEELMESLYFDLRFQYALHTTNMINQPISRNMFTNFRNMLISYEIETGKDLLKEEILSISKEINKCIKKDKTLKRMDSIMIESRCKHLSRIDLVYKVNVNLINKINEMKPEKLEEREKEYLKSNFKKDKIMSVTKSNVEKRLKELLNDSIVMYKKYKEEAKIKELEEFKLLERLVNEQLNGDNTPKSSKEISPSSLQNPSDKDATYRYKYKNNIGYIGNIVEEIGEDIAIITDYDLKQNTYSDQNFMLDYIEKKEEKEIEDMLVDAGYFSGEIKEKAEKKHINLIPTQTMGVKKEDTIISEFKIDEQNHTILSCPNGELPIKTKYLENEKVMTAKFDKTKCECCPMRNKCLLAGIIKKRISSVRFTKSSYVTSTIRKSMEDENYKKLSDKRAGIEGIPSVLRRRYGVDNLASFGLMRTKIKYGCALMAINIKRMVKRNRKASISSLIEQVINKILKNISIFNNYSCISYR